MDKKIMRPGSSQENLIQTLEFLPVPVVVANLSGNILFVNRAFEQTFGYTHAEIPTVFDWHQRAYPDPAHREAVVKTWDADVAAARVSGQTAPLRVYQITTQEKRELDVELSIRVVQGQLIVVFNDVTECCYSEAERQRTEQALREKTEEIEKFFSGALDLLCIANTDGYFERLNLEWEKVLGYRQGELEGQRFLDFVHPDDVEMTLAAVSQLNAQNEVINFTNRYRCKDGSYRWIEWRSYPAGQKIYAAARDITERQQVANALAQERLLLRTVIDNLPDAIYAKDLQARKTLANRTDLNNIGAVSEDEVLGKNDFELFPHDVASRFNADDHRVLRTG